MEKDSEKEWGLSQEEFLIWCIEKAEALVNPFLQLIYEVCHIVLGLRPQCKHQEQRIGKTELSYLSECFYYNYIVF